MKLYVTFTSPYARLAWILVIEKGLEDRVDVIEAKTRVANRDGGIASPLRLPVPPRPL
jgi:hypothetical protein